MRRRHEASVGLRLLKDRFVGRRPDSFQRSGSAFEGHYPLARRSQPRRTKKQSDPHRRACADLALDGHPASVGLGDAPADRQTQTGAARAGGSSGIDPVEPLAQVRQVLRRDPFAGIVTVTVV